MNNCMKCMKPIKEGESAVEVLYGSWCESEGLIDSPEKYEHYHEKCWKDR